MLETVAAQTQSTTLEELIPNAPPEAIDLLKKLFTYDTDERLTAEQVLSHPFLEGVYVAGSNQG
jgi:serine/threonine protein kinase